MIAGLGARRCRELRRYGGSGRPRETVTPSSVRNPGGRSDPAIRTAATSLRPLPSFGPRALPSFRPSADRALCVRNRNWAFSPSSSSLLGHVGQSDESFKPLQENVAHPLLAALLAPDCDGHEIRVHDPVAKPAAP